MGAKSPDAAALWEAAADAMAWTAAVREHASWTVYRKAWVAKAESDGAMKRMAEECGRAVDRHGAIDPASTVRVRNAMKRAADPLVRASKAFALSSRLDEAAGADLRRAHKAYGLAGDPEYAAIVHDRAAGSYKHALDTARLAESVICTAESLMGDAVKLANGAARWQSLDLAWQASRAPLSALQADMWEDAKQARAESAAMLGKADEGVQATAKMRRLTARAAEMSASKAAAAAARGQGRPDVERAAAEWRRAVAKAHRVEDRSRRRAADRTA